MLKKFGWILGIVLIVSVFSFGEAKKVAQQIALKTQKEKLSYSIGMDIGTGMKKQEVDIDMKLFMKGLTDGLSGDKPLLTPEEIKAVFEVYQQEMSAKRAEKFAKLAVQNKKDGEAFLAANGTKEGIVTLSSGLQYKVVTEGNGPKPAADDTVTVHYRGTLIDGTEFDSSYKRNQPAKFMVTQVIPGWTEALQLMKAGSKWQLFIPANLAYGENGAGQTIEPNMTLVFEVELLAIEPKTTVTPNP